MVLSRLNTVSTFARFCFVLTVLFSLSVAQAGSQAGNKSGNKAAIASAHPIATEAGFKILAAGGNAFDAAIAVTATLAVVEPMGSGLGGGGFWLIHRASDGFETMIDGRERAPLAATHDMYLDQSGQVIAKASLDGALAAAIPGVPAALEHLANHYGRLPLSKSMAPAIQTAKEGFPVYGRYRMLARFRLATFIGSESERVFLVDGKVPREGVHLKQPQLARTLKRIARKGRAGFYSGLTARRLLKAVRSAGGIWTQADLDGYTIKERDPVRIKFRNSEIVTASLPSSGGIVLAEIFNILETMNLSSVSALERKRRIIEAMRRGYHDRARYLGDADFIKVDRKLLTSKRYAVRRAKSIRNTATPSKSFPRPGHNIRPRGADTSHFSIIDAEGNRVAATLSINYPFGSGFMPKGTGVVLNNEMDDFVMKSGTPNVYGLVGARANSIEPGKRPLSSMSPTFITKEDQVLVLGTPGGSRIISMVLLAALEFIEGRGDPQDWVSMPRYHHQYLPDVIEHEAGAFNEFERLELQDKGYELKEKKRRYGNMHLILLNQKTGTMRAASDPRGEGLADVR